MPPTTIQPLPGSYVMPRLEHATVSDAMHPGILSCEPDATLTDVARLMATHHVHCIAVMAVSSDRPDEKLVWGVITDADVLRAGMETAEEPLAAAVAGQEFLRVQPTMPLRKAGELMLSHGSSHVVVIEPQMGRPIGILSTLDIAGVLAWGEA